jgi:hypothetical protein
MMRLRFFVPVLGFSSLLGVACSGDDPSVAAGEGGEAGEATSPVAGGGVGGSGGEGGGCTLDATGQLVIEVSGLPGAVDPEVIIEGPDDLLVSRANDSIDGVTSGAYTASASRVFDADPIVRTVFDATVTMPDFTLCDGASHTIKVAYEAIPSSNKLWMPTALDDEGAGFSSSAIAESGLTDATVSLDGGIGTAIAFDRDGNMWTLGPSTFPTVLRFPAAELGDSGAPEPDVSFDVPEITCTPTTRSLALDASGNLWLSACEAVLRIPAADLNGVGGEKVADVLIAGLDDNQGMAFDADGNLWVGTALGLARFDATRLDSPTGDPPDFLLSVKDALAPVRGWYLAFDPNGNLWASDAIAGSVFEVAAADLTGSGEAEVEAKVSIELDVLALPDQIAFDDGGGLWVGLKLDSELEAAGIGRLSPAQLLVSTEPGEPVSPATTIYSKSVGTGLPVAFFPAPAGLPLYHSIPVE